MLCQLPLIVFKRYDSCRVRQWERGDCCGLEAKTARKVPVCLGIRFFFHGRVAQPCAYVCVCVCVWTCMHGGRAALDKSPFDVCLSDFEWNGNRGWRKQGGRRSRKYHFSWYHTLLSCLAFATDYERKVLLNRGLEISSGTKKKKNILLFPTNVKIILTIFRACWGILYAVPRKFACLNENPRNGGTFPE